MIIFKELFDLISNDKLVEIKTPEAAIFKGYKGNAIRDPAVIAVGEREVINFSVVPEISRRDRPSDELIECTELNCGRFNYADLRHWDRYTYTLKNE